MPTSRSRASQRPPRRVVRSRHCAPRAASAIVSAINTPRPSTRRSRPSSCGRPSACSPTMPSALTRTTNTVRDPPRLAQMRAAGPYQARDQRGAGPCRSGPPGHGPQRLRRGRTATGAGRSLRSGPSRGRPIRAPTSAVAALPPRISRMIFAGSWASSTPPSSASNSTMPTGRSKTAAGALAPMAAGPTSRTAAPVPGAATSPRQPYGRRDAECPRAGTGAAARAQHHPGSFPGRREGAGTTRSGVSRQHAGDRHRAGRARARQGRPRPPGCRDPGAWPPRSTPPSRAAQYADADRLIADGRKRYPFFTGWPDLSKRLADARRASPAQAGNAPMPPATPDTANSTAAATAAATPVELQTRDVSASSDIVFNFRMTTPTDMPR